MKITIHEADKPQENLQACKLCGITLLNLTSIDKKTFKIRERVQSVKNTTTTKPSITSKGWKEGTYIKVSPHKTETTNEKPNCTTIQSK